MPAEDIVRVWKDPELRASGASVAHPAGEIDLGIHQLVGGGDAHAFRTEYLMSLGCCQGFTSGTCYSWCGFRTCGDLCNSPTYSPY